MKQMIRNIAVRVLPIVMGLVCISFSAQAQNRNNKKKVNDSMIARYSTHYITVWGGGGYSGLLNNYPTATGGLNGLPINPNKYFGTFDSKFVGGGGGMIGFGYEWQYKRFILDVGPEFRAFSSSDKILLDSPYNVDYVYTDALGSWPMTNHYQFEKNYRENNVVGQIMLPVMFGAKFEYWYFLAGAKVGYTLFDFWHQRGDLTTSVTDRMAIEDWYDLSEQYSTAPYHQRNSDPGKVANKFGLDVAVTAEVGVNIEDFLSSAWNNDNNKRRFPYHFRVAAFVDYGVLNLNVTQGTALVAADATSVTTGSLHASEWATSPVNSLLVGVKGTFLLQLNKPKGRKPLTPQLATTVWDKTNLDKPVLLAGATVNVLNQDAPAKSKTKKAPKPKKVTSGKQGTTLGKFKEGTYNIWAEKVGYFNSDTIYDLTLEEPEVPEGKRAKPEPVRVEMSLVKVPVWTVNVKDAKTGAGLQAKVQLIDAEGGELLSKTLRTAEDGTATFTFNDPKYLGKNYRVKISADKHIYQEGSVSDIYGSDTYLLEPIVPKKEWILKNMYFATNKTEILPMSEESLKTLYDFLKENPRVRIKIIGHTDSVGTDQANQKLSEGRAASVKNEMVKRGIKAERIQTEGRGESEPIDTNDTEEGRQNNRRVVIQVL
ncbi:MAG: OmpA family protein [Paludibacteraceae bacterium]|nr:OmpA family protein [Paludibacteraceae bacterium]